MKGKRANAQPPKNHTGLTKNNVPKSSVGPKAVVTALKHVNREMDWDTGFKVLKHLNRHQGIDCPGCAWPDPQSRSKFGEFCENGVKAVTEEATNKLLDDEFFQKHSIYELSSWSDYEIGKSGRLSRPMVLHPGGSHYQTISWDEAFGLISNELKSLESPDEAIFYTSGRTSNEAAFLYQLFVRKYGTNNLPDCSNMCHESSGKALTETLGIGKGSVRLSDFEQADLVIVIGQNPGTNHPRMLTTLEKCKKRGGKIITINPLPELGLMSFTHPQQLSGWLGKSISLTDLFLQVRVNGDVALLKAILKILLDRESSGESVFDQQFIENETEGYDDLVKHLREQDLDHLIEMSGVTRELVFETADAIEESRNIIVCWAMGLTQHQNAVDNIREIVNLLLVKGSIGRPGAGTCPVRGHSNVQGDRTMGIWEAPCKSFLDKLQNNFNFNPPREDGYDTVESIEAMHNGKAKVFFALGGNFLSATPDTELTAEALRSCDLTVHVSTKLNRSHLIHGKRALILPCLGRTDRDIQDGKEQFVSVENSMGVVHSSQGVLSPVSTELKSEVEIIVRLATLTLNENDTIEWENLSKDYDQIRDLIERTIPGFEDYNTRVRTDEGFELPNGARYGKFHTPTGKALFTINRVMDNGLGDHEFLMMTIRSHDQFNTTIYGLNDRYRGIQNERRIVFMNPRDMEKEGYSEGDIVDLVSNYGKERVAEKFIIIAYDIPTKCVATYFPEANVLVPIDHTAHTSNTPASKSVKIKMRSA